MRKPPVRVYASLATLTPPTSTDSPSLVTVPNIELIEVGEDWACSTGVFTFTLEDLQSAIESQADPFVRTPVVKLGHTDPRFDGQPSLGRIQNLHLSENKQTLLGDLVGVPIWLADCMASAFPRRSIEGWFGMTPRSNNEWPFVLEAVALLGEAYPAINCLEDVQALFGGEPPVLVPVAEIDHVLARTPGGPEIIVKPAEQRLLVNATRTVPAETQVLSSASIDDVRNAFYNGPAANPEFYWWWIREIRVDPMEVIVDDDAGNLFRVPYTLKSAKDGIDAVSFGDPQQVRIQYVDVVAAGQSVAKRFGNPVAAGRPRVRATIPPTNQKGTDMQPSAEVLLALGLAVDATEEEVNAAMLAKLSAPATDTAPPTVDVTTPIVDAPLASVTPIIPEGMQLIDTETLNTLKEGVAATASLIEDRDNQRRNQVLDTAIKAGKFPPARRAAYEALLKADRDGTETLIASLADDTIPVRGRGVESVESEVAAAADASAYPKDWDRTVKAAQRRNNSIVKVGQD
jgi:hypothetical protein